MGADSSKEQRSSPRDERPRHTTQSFEERQRVRATWQQQAPTYQSSYQSPTRQAPAERSTAYSSPVNLQSVIKQTSQPVLERSRNPYNYNSEELYGIKNPNLYPNLNVSPDHSFVHVNTYGQSRLSPQPSAPPAPEVNVEANVTSPRDPLSQTNLVQKGQMAHVTAAPKAPARPIQPSISRPAFVQSRLSPQLSAPDVNVPSNVTSPRDPLSQTNLVQKGQMAHVTAAQKAPPRPTQPSTSSHNVLGTSQPVPFPTNNKNINSASPNAPGPSKSANPVGNKNGPKSAGSPNPPGPSKSANPVGNRNGPKSAGSPNPPGPSKSANPVGNKNGPKSAGRGHEHLSCPTCDERLGINIFQCATGHGCCKNCRAAERSCGKCLSPITDIRNIALEAVVADNIIARMEMRAVKNRVSWGTTALVFTAERSCRNCISPVSDMKYIALEAVIAHMSATCLNQGCTLRFKFDEMERHLKECPFGEMDCPMGTVFGRCSFRCKVADMATHFDECHKEQRAAEIGKEMFVFNICMETHKLFLVKNGPYTFLVHVQVDESARKISMTVQLIGTKISAEKWTYEFHVYNKRQPQRKYLFVDKCQSIGTPVKDIFKESQCAILPLSYAMTFVNESALTYKFYIKKEMNRRGRPRNRNAD